MKTISQYSVNLICVYSVLGIPLLNVYQTGLHMFNKTMCTIAIFIKSKFGNSKIELNKMDEKHYIHSVGYHIAMGGGEHTVHATTWITLTNTKWKTLGQQNTFCMILSG